MIELLDPLLTAALAATTALAAWLATWRWHLLQMFNMKASHREQNVVALGHLAEARQQVSLLRKEVVDLRARSMSTSAPRALVEPSVRRTVNDTASRWQRSGDESGFPDTQPWSPDM